MYLATEVGNGIGAGYVLGGSYRPRTEFEATELLDANNVFLDDQPLPTAPTAPGAAIVQLTHDAFRGPLILYTRSVPGGIWSLIQTKAVYDGLPGGQEIAIGADSFQRNHTFLIALEGVQPNTNFEFNYDAHYEGIPVNMITATETREVPLPDSYATTLDILRKYHDG